ncbi:MAG: hypothetical protein RR704_18630 [Stenotrophomonas sp.]
MLLSAPAAAAPDPIVQVNYPVIALGETETLRLQLSAHPGGLAGALVTYSIHMNRLDSGHSSGYRVLEVRCPPEFLSNVYSGHAGAVCYRESGTPHPAGRRTAGDGRMAPVRRAARSAAGQGRALPVRRTD